MLRSEESESEILGKVGVGVGSRKFWKGRSRDSEILESSESDILPPTLHPYGKCNVPGFVL